MHEPMGGTYRPETLAVRAGQAPDPTRTGNPAAQVLEQRVAALEGGVQGVAFASGHAAIAGVVMSLAGAGDEVVSASPLYGGAETILGHTLRRLGITVRCVDPSDPENFRRAITDRTKLIFAEMIGHPTLGVLDVAAVAAVAHGAGIPLVVDNTFATPALCRPLEWGADMVIHSATQWLDGHGTVAAGVVVDGGRGARDFAARLRSQAVRELGACLSPMNASLVLPGIETLHLRMRQQCENALLVAEFLRDHPAVAWVHYPGLPDHPSYPLVQRYFDGGMGGPLITFGIKGGPEAGRKFMDSLTLWSHPAGGGGVRSLAIHPAGTPHCRPGPAEQTAAGRPDDLIRLSVGIEHADDLIADLDRALCAATGRTVLAVDGLRSQAVNDEEVIRWVLRSPYVTENGPDGRPVTRPKVIAVVGASNNPERPSNRVARKMRRLGYKVVPVNPKETAVLGEKAYPDLKSIPFPVDVVQVFRAPEAAVAVAKEAAAIGARVLWLQEGVVNEEAVRVGLEAGMAVVQDRCTYKEVRRLKGAVSTFRL